MDWETILIDGAFVAADICLLGIFYKLYKNNVECLKSLLEVESLEINSDLPKSVVSSGGIKPYVAISGNVKALTTPLRSHHFSFYRGVILEQIRKEQKIRWSPLLHVWDSSERAIQKTAVCIPFGLSGGSFFKKQIVEVIDPLKAEELVLAEVYDDFKAQKENFADILLGYVRGEHTIGTLEVENMLLEDTPLTAVGKLAFENDKLKIMPPGNGLTYFLTPLSLDSLIEKIRGLTYFYKALVILMSTSTVILLAYLSKKGFVEMKRRINRARELKRCEQARKMRRNTRNNRNYQNEENDPKCVVCLENTVEVLILECGHICLCFECSEQCNTFCPVCRTKITRLVPAFLP